LIDHDTVSRDDQNAHPCGFGPSGSESPTTDEQCETCAEAVCGPHDLAEHTPWLASTSGADERESGPAIGAVTRRGRPPVRHVRLGAGLDAALNWESGRTGAPASEILRRALAAWLG